MAGDDDVADDVAAAAAKSLQSCPTLCDPVDGSPLPGILQARVLEWVAVAFSVDVVGITLLLLLLLLLLNCFSRVRLYVTR